MQNQTTRRLDRLAIFLLLLGAMTIGYGMYEMENVGKFVRAGIGLWLVAYFTVIVENLMTGRDVQTRGGLVRREDGMSQYVAPFIPLILIGLLAGIFLIAS